MSLQRDTFLAYVGRWDTATPGHPQGPFRNRTSPTSDDGSFNDESWVNDWDGFMSSLLDGNTGLGVPPVAANGSVDAVGSSQYFNQLLALIAATPGYASGDHAASSDNTGMLARGFVLANIPPLIKAQYSFGAFATVGTYPGTAPNGIAVNSTSGDIFVTDTSDNAVYKLPGGVGSWSAIGTYPGTAPIAVAVRDSTGDVFVLDIAASNHIIYKLTGGVGSWAQVGTLPNDDFDDIAINNTTGDLWLTSSSVGGAFALVYVLRDGTSTYTLTGNYPGFFASQIAVNSNSGDVVVRDIVTTILQTTNQTDQLYVLTKGIGRFRQVQNVNYQGGQIAGLAYDTGTNDLIIGESSTPSILWRSPGDEDDFINEVELSGSFLGRVAVNSGDGSTWFVDTTNDEPVKSIRTTVTPATDWYVKT